MSAGGGWQPVVFGDDGEVLLPEGVEFVWYASRAKTPRGTWHSWRMECVTAHSLRVLHRSLRAIWKTRDLEVVWRPIEVVPEPPPDELPAEHGQREAEIEEPSP